MAKLDADTTLLALGRRIAELRAERGLTQEKLAEALAVSLKYAQRIESGRVNFTVRSLVRVANVLDARVDELFAEPVSLEAAPGRPPRRDGGRE